MNKEDVFKLTSSLSIDLIKDLFDLKKHKVGVKGTLNDPKCVPEV